jgi:hypothetical protein
MANTNKYRGQQKQKVKQKNRKSSVTYEMII